MENKFEGLNKMAKEIYQNNKEKGFWDRERNVGETLMLIVTELAEAMEAYRSGNLSPLPVIDEEDHEIFRDVFKDTFEDEIADTLIRILDFCGGMDIDIEWHVKNKVRYNTTRPTLHGKSM